MESAASMTDAVSSAAGRGIPLPPSTSCGVADHLRSLVASAGRWTMRRTCSHVAVDSQTAGATRNSTSVSPTLGVKLAATAPSSSIGPSASRVCASGASSSERSAMSMPADSTAFHLATPLPDAHLANSSLPAATPPHGVARGCPPAMRSVRTTPSGEGGNPKTYVRIPSAHSEALVCPFLERYMHGASSLVTVPFPGPDDGSVPRRRSEIPSARPSSAFLASSPGAWPDSSSVAQEHDFRYTHAHALRMPRVLALKPEGARKMSSRSKVSSFGCANASAH